MEKTADTNLFIKKYRYQLKMYHYYTVMYKALVKLSRCMYSHEHRNKTLEYGRGSIHDRSHLAPPQL